MAKMGMKGHPPVVSTGKSDVVPTVPASALREKRQAAWDELQVVKRKDPAKAAELRHTLHELSAQINQSEKRPSRQKP